MGQRRYRSSERELEFYTLLDLNRLAWPKVEAALDELTLTQRDIISARFGLREYAIVGTKTFKEIAQQQGKSYSTVYEHYRKAVEKIRRQTLKGLQLSV